MEWFMRPIGDEELKKIELGILRDVTNFCDNHDIKYYLCGGTLLGAVRHQGFIPWDDDIDIAMPRKDYIKFVQTYKDSTKRYRVDEITITPGWWNEFAKVGDTKTIIFDKHWKKQYQQYHVFIDVFPLDGLPSSDISKRILFLKQKLLWVLHKGSACDYSQSVYYSDSFKKNVSLKNKIRTFFKYIAITLCSGIPTQKILKLINKTASRCSFEDAKEVALIVGSQGGVFEKASRKAFEERKRFLFEGELLWGPNGYDEYLTNLYGDYMQLPPVENRVTHHTFTAFMI